MDFSKLDAYLDHARLTPSAEAASPGLAVAVVNEGAIVYARAVGQYLGNPITIDTPIPVGSLSKPVFAYATFKPSERGILDLDTALAQHLPDAYTANEPHLALLTARDTLSHTSGFPNWRAETGLRCIPARVCILLFLRGFTLPANCSGTIDRAVNRRKYPTNGSDSPRNEQQPPGL